MDEKILGMVKMDSAKAEDLATKAIKILDFLNNKEKEELRDEIFKRWENSHRFDTKYLWMFNNRYFRWFFEDRTDFDKPDRSLVHEKIIKYLDNRDFLQTGMYGIYILDYKAHNYARDKRKYIRILNLIKHSADDFIYVSDELTSYLTYAQNLIAEYKDKVEL